MYPRKKGFTLLEVLIVMVIIASLFSFAFPAYKKAQDRNKYLNARGVLEDLGFAVRELQANLTQADPSRAFPDTSAVLLERAYQNTASSSYTTAAATNLQDLAGADLPYALFAQTYMQPIMFDGTTGNEVNAYLFYKLFDF